MRSRRATARTSWLAPRSVDAARRPNVDRRLCSAAGAALHFSAARPYVGVSGRFRPWLGSMRRPSRAVSRSVSLAGTASAADRLLTHSLLRQGCGLGRRCGGLAAEQRGRGPPQPPVRCGGGSSTPMRHPCAIDQLAGGSRAGSVRSTTKWAPSSSATPRAATTRGRRKTRPRSATTGATFRPGHGASPPRPRSMSTAAHAARHAQDSNPAPLRRRSGPSAG